MVIVFQIIKLIHLIFFMQKKNTYKVLHSVHKISYIFSENYLVHGIIKMLLSNSFNGISLVDITKKINCL
jgi:succinate dehydrogenase/fumarate reductase cytochrome b subunit